MFSLKWNPRPSVPQLKIPRWTHNKNVYCPVIVPAIFLNEPRQKFHFKYKWAQCQINSFAK